MDRLVAARPGALLLNLLGIDGLPAAATSATVTGTSRRDGTTPIDGAAATAVDGSDGAQWRLDLDGTEVTAPTVLDTVWTVTIGGQQVLYPLTFDVAGAEYASIAAVVARVPSASVGDVGDALAAVAERIESYTRWVWVPRWFRQTVMSDRHGTIRLPKAPIRRLLAARADATGDDLDVSGWRWIPEGVVHTGRYRSRLTVDWEAGEDEPDADLARAALIAAEDAARVLSIRDRRRSAELGEGRFPFQHADLARRRPFGIDGVDVVVNGRVRMML